MPHSGGGGSHSSGGHHSGGSHRSSSSSGTYKTTGFRKTYYPGAHRYVVYNRNRAPEYIFSDKSPAENAAANKFGIAMFAFVGIVFVLVGIIMIISAIQKPKRLEGIKSGYEILDEAGILTDTEELSERLETFYDITGISPTFLTVNNEDWQQYFNNLSAYAYERYVKGMPDEKCWLIVYSEPGTKDEAFNDWYWETMVGDDTDKILNDDILETFNKTFNDNLFIYDAQDADKCLADALYAIEPDLMGMHVDGELIAVSIVWIIISAGISIAGVIAGLQARRYENAIPCPVGKDSKEIVKEAHCEYCNSIYVVGTIKTCPNCGAPVKTLEDLGITYDA